jgi:hypothetical protein
MTAKQKTLMVRLRPTDGRDGAFYGVFGAGMAGG